MFHKSWHYRLAFCIGIACGIHSNAVLSQEIMVTGTTGETMADSINWLAPELKADLSVLYSLAENAALYGLDSTGYKLPAIAGTTTFENNRELNAQIHDVANRFFTALAYGTLKPSFRYEGITIPPCKNINRLLSSYTRSHKLAALADSLNKPVMPLLKNINWYWNLMSSRSFREIKVSSKQVDISNKSLIEKLYQLNFLSTMATVQPGELKKAVLQAQKGFDLLADGKIRSTFIEQLNVPVVIRMRQCKQAVNDIRWLRCLADQEETILINIPAAYMQVYRTNELVLSMRMVVGKKSTPTPTFTSRIQEVILYPYWHVPHSIATKELLPLIKINPAFIDKGGYQVLNRQGKIMDPYRINWQALSPGNFPYLIRQSTGCDNALGLLKLNFYTPFGVYLHDTPSKNSFNLNKRYFSHGCMRMEKPMELGRMILKENTIAIDTLTSEGCLTNQSPVTVKALHKMALVVWYNPAAIDASGNVIFYEDVYKKFK